jgi:hypothetical protein
MFATSASKIQKPQHMSGFLFFGIEVAPENEFYVFRPWPPKTTSDTWQSHSDFGMN